MRRSSAGFAAYAMIVLAGTAMARADEAKSTCAVAESGIPGTSIASSLPPGLADPGGIRAALGRRGVQLGFNYIGEVLSDARGGTRRGTIYDGRLEITVDACLDKLLGWQGAIFHANGYQIHGTGLSTYYVGNILPVSNIEAPPATKLYEAYIDQTLFDGKISLRFGQLGGDTEFVAPTYGALFINGTFGWPPFLAANLPNGGPAYPLATPGIRLKYMPNDTFTLLAGLYNGAPAGPTDKDRRGLAFRVRDKPLLIGEAQYKYQLSDTMAGTVKIGAWRHFGRFDDQRFDDTGLSLADPLTSGIARRHRGDYGLYGMLDHAFWQNKDGSQYAAMFARIAGTPASQNLIDFYAEGGFSFKGILPGREQDAFGIAVGYAKVSSRARGLDFDTIVFNGPAPVRDHEAVVEATYSLQVMDGWTIQPNAQYIMHPGLHVTNPRDPAGRVIKDAVVIGVRSTVNY